MRKIDLLAGVPCCVALTLFDKLRKLVKETAIPETPPKKILFIELAETGGLVVACPALEHARKRFPDADIYFMTFSLGDGILRLLDYDDEHRIIIRTSSLPVFLKDTLAAIKRVRELGIDAVINLESFARFSTLLAYFSGAPRRVGYHRYHDEGRYIGDLLTHKAMYSPHMHAGRSFIGLVECLTEAPDSEPRVKRSLADIPLDIPKVPISDSARDNIIAKLKSQYPSLSDDNRLVLLNPNASDLVATRRWPDESFLTLARKLMEDENVLIVFTGAPNERSLTSKLQARLDSKRVLNMAGETTLPELIDLYNVADLLVTNDSGPAHFASLTDINVLVLFGPETPRIYGPLGRNAEAHYLGLTCSPCVSSYNQKRSPCRDNQCLKLIEPETILKRARALLAGDKAQRNFDW